MNKKGWPFPKCRRCGEYKNSDGECLVCMKEALDE